MADTIAEIVKTQEKLEKLVATYKDRFVKLRNLDRLETELADLGRRITALEKKK